MNSKTKNTLVHLFVFCLFPLRLRNAKTSDLKGTPSCFLPPSPIPTLPLSCPPPLSLLPLLFVLAIITLTIRLNKLHLSVMKCVQFNAKWWRQWKQIGFQAQFPNGSCLFRTTLDSVSLKKQRERRTHTAWLCLCGRPFALP